MPFTQLPGWVGAGQALQENQLMMDEQRSNLQSMALHQEDARLTLEAKKAELANQEAFKQSVLANLSSSEDTSSQLASIAGQPTAYQKLHNNLNDVNDRIKSHVSLIQATQAAIEEYAHKDPLYAQRQQEELNKQIKAGFDLSKEQFELKSKEAEKVSNELYPVLNSGETGKFDADLYRQWYANRQAEGVPLASMGLTGDPTMDEKQLRLIYSHGVAAKDQMANAHREVLEKERQYKDAQTEKMNQHRINHDTKMEGLAQQRIDVSKSKEEREARKTSATKDPRAVAVKEANALSNTYQAEHDRLASQYNAPPKSTETTQQYNARRANLLKQMDALTKNYKQKEAAIYSSHGVKTSTTESPASSGDFWNK